MPSAGYAPVWARASVSALISSMVRSVVCAEAGSQARPIRAAATIIERVRICFCVLPIFPAIMSGRGRRHKGWSVWRGGLGFAHQVLDASLQLALLFFAPAQPFSEVRAGQFVGMIRAERHADEIVAPPDDLGHDRAALARDRQPQGILRDAERALEFEMSAAFRNVAHHAIPGRATFGDLGGPAVNHLVTWAMASLRHRKLPIGNLIYYASRWRIKGQRGQKAALT